MRAVRAIATLLALLCPVWALAGGGWQDTPDTLRLEAMGDTLRMNGTPMDIRAFHGKQPIEALLRDVQASWERQPGHAPVRRTTLPNWIVLNQAVGDQHRSFQVRAQGEQVEGFVALTSPAQRREPVLAMRLPPQMLAMQIVDSVDQGRASQQVTAVSTRSIEATAMALDQSLRASGWQRQVLKKQGGALRLSASRGAEQFDAILSAQKTGALVLISTVQ